MPITALYAGLLALLFVRRFRDLLKIVTAFSVAHTLTLAKDGSIAVKEYWDLDFNVKTKLSRQDAERQVRAIVEEYVATEEPVGSKAIAQRHSLGISPATIRNEMAALEDAGYVVDRAFDGEEGHFLGDTEPYDAVVLDLGLPKLDGVTVLERWRKAGRKMPVLILTARDRWSDKVAGFDAGADDYVAKPFYTEELLARLRALLRRAAGIASPDIEIGPLRIDTRSSRVTVDGNPVKLTSAEYRLLSYLAHHKGEVMSRTDLVEHLYDQDFDRDSNTVEVFIGRLRKKLPGDLIKTVRGLGYCLSDAPE